jgi:hypothetical protein
MTSRHKMQNNHYNNPFNPGKPLVFEGLEYKDMEGLLKPTIHVDEFAAKMGDDDDIIVISFFVRDLQASKDLMAWFEKGYDFVLDADRSPGEIKPSRYLVYVEIRRRSTAPLNINRLLEDLSSLTEFDPSDWRMHYKGKDVDWSEETFAELVPLTPDDYRQRYEGDLNEMRMAAGLPTKAIYEPKADVRSLQAMAGLR